MKTIVVGLGNPILSDDGVGIRIARELKERIGNSGGSVDVVELYAGGIRLMDALMGYERALIIDALVTESSSPGEIFDLSPSDLVSTRNTVSTHDMNLPTALEMGKMLELPLPSDIKIWGIGAKDVETFSEELTEDVARAVPVVLGEIIQYLGG